jgi:hypothetical protein
MTDHHSGHQTGDDRHVEAVHTPDESQTMAAARPSDVGHRTEARADSADLARRLRGIAGMMTDGPGPFVYATADMLTEAADSIENLLAKRDHDRIIESGDPRCNECGGYGRRGCGAAWHDSQPDTHCSPACQCRDEMRADLVEAGAEVGRLRATNHQWAVRWQEQFHRAEHAEAVAAGLAHERADRVPQARIGEAGRDDLAVRLRAVAGMMTDDPPWVFVTSDMLTEAAAEIESLRADEDAVVAERDALCAFVYAHDAVEQLIADHPDDPDSYNAAVERLRAARAGVDPITRAHAAYLRGDQPLVPFVAHAEALTPGPDVEDPTLPTSDTSRLDLDLGADSGW